MPKKINLLGRTFGHLTVIAEAHKGKAGQCYWLCRCSCMIEKAIIAQSLLHGRTFSCGCLKSEKIKLRATKHSGTVSNFGKRTPEWIAWSNMKARCNRPSCPEYPNYGGRGIMVCKRWDNSFENFLEDVGLRPTPEHSLDRYPDNDGHYEPSNVRWATVPQQKRNTSQNVWIEYKGERKVVKDWAVSFGFKQTSLRHHLKTKTFEDAVYYLTHLAKPKGAKGADNSHAKRVARYVNGVLVKEYDYVKQVEEDGFVVKRVYDRLNKYSGRDADNTLWKYIDEPNKKVA